MLEDDTLREASKAVQAVAQTTGQAIEASEKLGGFVARFVAGPLREAAGIVEDKLKYLRWERQLRLMKRAEDFMRELGISEPTRAVPLKVAIPLLQGALVEDDDELQDLWAKLLVNAADADSLVVVQRMFVDILQSIGPLEARILQTIYSMPFDEMNHREIETKNLPSSAVIRAEGESSPALDPSPDVALALANLSRLGCLTPGKTWGGGELFGVVHVTRLGKAFMDACTLRARAI